MPLGHEIRRMDKQGRICVIKLAGELDSESSLVLDHLLMTESASVATHVIVDVSDVRFISSSGWRIFVQWSHHRPRDGRFILCGMRPEVLEIFGILGLEGVIETCSVVEDAMALVD